MSRICARVLRSHSRQYVYVHLRLYVSVLCVCVCKDADFRCGATRCWVMKGRAFLKRTLRRLRSVRAMTRSVLSRCGCF